MNKNFKITGDVSYCGKSNNDDDRIVVMLKVNDTQIERLQSLFGDIDDYDGIPLKEAENGEILFKMSSKFDVTLYDNGVIADEDELTVDDIGKGSRVQCFFGLGDSTYKRRKFKVAYLKSINIIDLVESSKFNPFTDEAEVDEI